MGSASGHRKTLIKSDMLMRNAVKSPRKRNAVWKDSSKVVMPEVLNVSAEKANRRVCMKMKLLFYPRSVGV